MAFSRRILIVICGVSLSACSHFIKPSPSSENQEEASPAQQEQPEEKFGDFSQEQDTLYDLLVGEIAGQRQQLPVTLVNYIHQARATKDVEIIKRAINVAQYLKDVEAITEMGLLWTDADPNSIPAHQLLAFQYSLRQNFTAAMDHIDQVIALGGDARVDSLALGAQALPQEKKRELIELYKALSEKYPNKHEISHSLALLYHDIKDFDKALELLNPILEKHPDFEASVLLKTSILIQMGDLAVAEEFAAEQYDQLPHVNALGRMYASVLIDNNKLDEAEEVFSQLLNRFPNGPGLRLSRALVMLENKKIDNAKSELEALIEQGIHLNESHFYLGRIADIEQQTDIAIEHYFQVDDSIHFEAALERGSYLLTQADRTDEAIERLSALRLEKPDRKELLWIIQYKIMSSLEDQQYALDTLNEALIDFPLNEQLLYSRAMTYDQLGQLEEMEKDLRVIIENNPNHAVAINALGYTLADKTNRLDEALTLISLALKLKPENPAIQDSMGWVLYRLNKPRDALVFLFQAYQKYPDSEVAAHLGEVLFVLGRPDQAYVVWQVAYKKTPDHKVLNSTLERMAPQLLEALKNGQTLSVEIKEVDSSEPQPMPVEDSQ